MALAVTRAARHAAGGRGATDVKRHVDQIFYDRFLCRVFSDPESRFLLKGGTRMLAAVPSGRATRDVDLEARDHTLDVAVADLRRLAAVDLGDFLRYTFTGATTSTGANQPNVQTATVKFDVEIVGRGRQSPMKVDLAVHRRPSAPVVRAAPAFRVDIPEFTVVDYAMISMEDQMADKLCAMMSAYGPSGHGSSRAKDLVDLVIAALYERLDAAVLFRAIRTESVNRGLPPFTEVEVPAAIQAGYPRLAASVDPVRDHPDWIGAIALVNSVIEPVLSGRTLAGTWDPQRRRWVEPR